MPSPPEPPAEPSVRPSAEPPPLPASLGRVLVRTLTALEPTLLFDRAELALLEDGNLVRVLALDTATSAEPFPRLDARAHYSERLWADADPLPRVVADAVAELDAAHDADRRLLDAGARSLLVVPLRADD